MMRVDLWSNPEICLRGNTSNAPRSSLRRWNRIRCLEERNLLGNPLVCRGWLLPVQVPLKSGLQQSVQAEPMLEGISAPPARPARTVAVFPRRLCRAGISAHATFHAPSASTHCRERAGSRSSALDTPSTSTAKAFSALHFGASPRATLMIQVLLQRV
jgi:hypothetical protein